MRLQDYDTTTQFSTHVLSKRRLTSADAPHEVMELVIEVDSPDFQAEVGQNIGVLAPGQAEFGQQHHFRLYSLADVPQTGDDGRQQLSLCVRRCTGLDPYSGEEYPGVASNYLCDLAVGSTFTITGPYDRAFDPPRDNLATLILIGAGTGIAPFRAFVKYLYSRQPAFLGRVLLFHGAETGIDLLYRNDEINDFAMYYDQETFEAISALSSRPGWSETIDWGSALQPRGEELIRLLEDSHTWVYLAGQQSIRDELDVVLSEFAGSAERWATIRTEIEADGRWNELLY